MNAPHIQTPLLPGPLRSTLLGLPVWPDRNEPVLAAALSSLVGISIVAVSVLWTRRWTGLFLVWNLILAWLPLGFATLAERPGAARRARWTWGILWLLFFPNAPYIFTDLTHLNPDHDRRFWVELGVVLLFALTGLVVGYLSLHRMQRLVARHYGSWAGWGIVGAAAALGATGVAVGRFLRWNSWDALLHPWRLVIDIGGWLHQLPQDRETALFLFLFTLFLFFGYVMIHSMAALGEQPGPTGRTPTVR